MSTRLPLLVLVALLALFVAACAGGTGAVPAPVTVEAITPPPLGVRDTAIDPPRTAPALRLTDGDGQAFDLASLHGRPVFVTFGYTHCPDVCPTTLADLREALVDAGVEAGVVFVTIDPARDDAAAMKQYTDYYQAGFIGLTGTESQIADTAAAWGVTYSKLPSDSASGYAMAHSTGTYLVDADGMLRHHVFFGAPSSLIVELLRDVAGR